MGNWGVIIKILTCDYIKGTERGRKWWSSHGSHFLEYDEIQEISGPIHKNNNAHPPLFRFISIHTYINISEEFKLKHVLTCRQKEKKKLKHVLTK